MLNLQFDFLGRQPRFMNDGYYVFRSNSIIVSHSNFKCFFNQFQFHLKIQLSFCHFWRSIKLKKFDYFLTHCLDFRLILSLIAFNLPSVEVIDFACSFSSALDCVANLEQIIYDWLAEIMDLYFGGVLLFAKQEVDLW